MKELIDKFEDFRSELIHNVYDIVMKNGGLIKLDKPIELLFDTAGPIIDSDVFGSVLAIRLVCTDNDTVELQYKIPELNESNRYYVDEEGSDELFDIPLQLLSADELYNLISII